MSQRRPPPPKTPVPPPTPEDEEDDFDEEFEDGPDMLEALASLLATEEGETIATILAGTKEATEKVALQLEMQNKILVKIAASIAKLVPVTPTGIEAPA